MALRQGVTGWGAWLQAHQTQLPFRQTPTRRQTPSDGAGTSLGGWQYFAPIKFRTVVEHVTGMRRQVEMPK